MPALYGAFSVGKDVSLTVVHPITGVLMSTNSITDFDSSPQTKQIESMPLSSQPVFADIPHGWKLNFSVDRVDSTWDDFWVALEQAYWNGVTVNYATINELIQEKNGSVSHYTYVNVALRLDNAGTKKSQDKIVMKMIGTATQRIKQA
jgi:hypothetical protein